jgi:hypothetical protein
MDGRVHLYGGRAARDVTLGVYLARSLGATRLVLADAATAGRDISRLLERLIPDLPAA